MKTVTPMSKNRATAIAGTILEKIKGKGEGDFLRGSGNSEWFIVFNYETAPMRFNTS